MFESICPALSPDDGRPCRLPDTRAAHIAGHETERVGGHRSVWQTSPEDHARWEAAPALLEPITDALQSLARTMTSDPRDWGADRRDAWLYGVLVGWETGPDDPNSAVDELAVRHGWDETTVGLLRRLRRAVQAHQEPVVPERPVP